MVKVAIIGGGVSGLLVAAALKKMGHDIHIFDKAITQAKRGYGFLLMPNGVSALKNIGFWSALQAKGTPITQIVSQHYNGKSLSLKTIENVIGFSRPVFLNALANAENLLENVHYDYLSLSPEGHLYLGETRFPSAEYDWIIGSDGANSVVRKYLFPNSKLINAPTYEIVGTLYNPELATELSGKLHKLLFDHAGIALGLLPLQTGQLIWYLQLARSNHPPPERNHDQISLQHFVRHLLSPYTNAWIEQILQFQDENLYLWNGRILHGVDTYTRNKFLLMGDAAHVFLPFTSQGANMAIEDAEIFINLFKTMKSPQQLAENYHTQRWQRCKKVAIQGMEYAELFCKQSPALIAEHFPLTFTK